MKLKYLYDQLRSETLNETVNEALEEGKNIELSRYQQNLSPLTILDGLILKSNGLKSRVEGYLVEVEGDSQNYSIIKDRDLKDIETFLEERGVEYNKSRCLQ